MGTAFSFWMTALWGLMKGDPLDNAKLFNEIDELVRRNCTLSRVCRFKDWTYFVGTKAGEYINHHGIVLTVQNASGTPEKFLQLEYGARGTYWQLSTFPRPDP